MASVRIVIMVIVEQRADGRLGLEQLALDRPLRVRGGLGVRGRREQEPRADDDPGSAAHAGHGMKKRYTSLSWWSEMSSSAASSKVLSR